MRIFIIGLSILFFILSGLITYRALEIPDYDFSYKSQPEEPDVQAAEIQKQNAPEPPVNEQNDDQVKVEELQAAISRLEEKLAEREKEPVEQPAAEAPGKKEKVLAILGGGTFRSGQVVVSDSLMNSIDEIVKTISESPGYRVVIEGHTDNIPIKAVSGQQYQDNMDLSFLRAKAIARILIEKGVPRERISVAGYGDTRPVDSNDTEEGRAKNRRVAIKLVPEEGDLQ